MAGIKKALLSIWAWVVIGFFLYDMLLSPSSPVSSLLDGRAAAGGYIFFVWRLVVTALINYLVLFAVVTFFIWIALDVLRLAKTNPGNK